MRDLIRRLGERLEHWFPRFFASSPSPPDSARERCLQRLHSCVEYHRELFAEMAVTETSEVIHSLEEKRLVERGNNPGKSRWVRAETSVLGDVVLAQSCVEQQEPGSVEFLQRYQGSLGALANRMSPVFAEDFSLWEFYTVAPSESSAPRLERYGGRTVLKCYLEKCLRFEFCNWLTKRKREKAIVPMDSEPRERGKPGLRGWMADSDNITRVIRSVFTALSDQERLMLFWKYDQRPRETPGKMDRERTQTKLAALLGMHNGHLSRKYEELEKRLPLVFAQACKEVGLSEQELFDYFRENEVAHKAFCKVAAGFLREEQALIPESLDAEVTP